MSSLFPYFDHSDQDNFSFEKNLHSQGVASVAGVDEAGRGPLAGPVVAAAVILPCEGDFSSFIDSKKITSARKREELYSVLQEMAGCSIGVGEAAAQEIDAINILQASLLAMKRAVENCSSPRPEFLLVDGKFEVPLPVSQKTLIKGESKSASIAAASIIAKVTRDRLMADYHKTYPQYNFIKHKGYPTKEHRRLLLEFGPCPIHRLSFKGVCF